MFNNIKMKKYLSLLSLIIIFSGCSSINSDLAASFFGGARFSIPKNAEQINNHTYSLTSPDAKGLLFIEYIDDTDKNSDGENCYALASDAEWSTAEDFLFNGKNDEGIEENSLFNTVEINIKKWETAAGKDIFGNGSLTDEILSVDTRTPDGKNEIYVAGIDIPESLAVTVIWFNEDEIIEWDQVYNEKEFDWSERGESGKADFENISVHTIGHAAGLTHPADRCINETMAPSTGLGDTKKRILNDGDIFGIKKLYQ